MMNKARQKVTISTIQTTFSWLLVLLVIFGLSKPNNQAAFRLTYNNTTNTNIMRYICDYPQTPGEGSTDMTPDGLPAPEMPAYVVMPFLFKTDNSLKRGLQESRRSCCTHTLVIPNHNCRIITTSTSLVSSHLGRKFTLVGSKPSGTG
ncbi:MAG: hypothetical protein U9N55_08040 [candidate division Zixibacteria bacterium]|nr:hypothetical protein [candidate division Zixibacteria bacterium]